MYSSDEGRSVVEGETASDSVVTRDAGLDTAAVGPTVDESMTGEEEVE